jgi:hypothetical protein
MTLHRFCLVLLLAALLAPAQQRQRPPRPSPTYENVAYGNDERQVLDFWKAESAAPTPLVTYIHGGGFRGGRKEGINPGIVKRLVGAGISVAAIHYRLVPKNPLPAAHHDSRRALQFLRSKAGEWNIDKDKVAAFGGSAGAQICMYLAFHDDMADPYSPDPVARESTRLAFVATSGGQVTMDMDWWMKHIPEYNAPHRPLEEIYGDASDEQRRMIIEHISAFSLLTPDDPPLYMSYSMAPEAPVPTDPQRVSGWKVHHVNFGVELARRMDALGIENHLNYPGASPKYENLADFFIAKLK